MRSESPSIPTAMLLMVERCAVSANLIFNEQAAASEKVQAVPSLLMSTGSEVPSGGGSPIAPSSVTGNVFRGKTLLPPRPALVPPAPPAPPPMDTWDFFNGIVTAAPGWRPHSRRGKKNATGGAGGVGGGVVQRRGRRCHFG